MRSIWAKIVYVFSYISLSPSDDANSRQVTLPGLEKPAVGDSQSIDIYAGDGPKFQAPEVIDLPDYRNFTCRYPQMADYTPCSTDGDRSCWLKHKTNRSLDYNINTNYEIQTPIGITRKYYIVIGDAKLNPDGVPRDAMVINGSYPGPWIQACWGDDIEVTVLNDLKTNGTTIHWHGVRMLGTNLMDGVNAITQCPIAPGSTFTYKFKAQQYGTSWYHSHYSLQYGEGVLGPMTIHGPTSADWDYADYPVMMTDWTHKPIFYKWWQSVQNLLQAPVARSLDNVLLNGTGWLPNTKDTPGKTYKLDFQKGKRYLLRLINTSVETTFVFSIDNHKIQVIAADFVPITPYITDHVVVGIGQRYHVVVYANPIDGIDAGNGSYWIRTEVAKGCDVGNLTGKGIDFRLGRVNYNGSTNDPKDMRGNFDTTCRDEPYDKLVPILKWQVGEPANFASDSQFDIGMDKFSGSPFWPSNVTLTKWNMYSNTMWLNFSNPTVMQLESDKWDSRKYQVLVTQNSSLTDGEDKWMYMLVSGTGIPRDGRSYNTANHPIHLHGHDFAILQQSTKPYQLGNLKLKKDNPPRRDVAFMPSGGFLVLAFKADNPGIWLMHCHIAWHASGGLALQLAENMANITMDPQDVKEMKRTCDAWTTWKNDPKNHFLQDDSGV